MLYLNDNRCLYDQVNYHGNKNLSNEQYSRGVYSSLNSFSKIRSSSKIKREEIESES